MFTRAALTALLCLPFAIPASAASSWPGDAPSIGGAIAATAIGQHCAGTLTPAEIDELAVYQAKAIGEFAQQSGETQEDPAAFIARVARELTATYTGKYRDPAACDATADFEARDMLERVRKVMATGKPVLLETPSSDTPLPAQPALAGEVRVSPVTTKGTRVGHAVRPV